METNILPSSFRDPSGFIFRRGNTLYRQVNQNYKPDYDYLISSGLYKKLTNSMLLIPHSEVEINNSFSGDVYKTLKPKLISFISYPYEWCFSQIKHAALATLQIQKIAMEHNMTLKDCSAYNIQFEDSKPVFIDTLSFERYQDGRPWAAYKQFCQHFLAPLALMAYRDIRLNKLLQIFLDGIPLDLACSLLPMRKLLKPALLFHLCFHSKSQKFFEDKQANVPNKKVSKFSLFGLIDNLESAIKKIKWTTQDTEWATYYQQTNYSNEAFKHKKELINEFLGRTSPEMVWDIGANDGTFSRISCEKKIRTIAFDIDPAAVENNYSNCFKSKQPYLLPLLLDLTNPSPSIGWGNEERMSLLKRGTPDTVFALALIHHLAISNNLPFRMISAFFGKICRSLIIEFVPKSDSQVKRLLSTRQNIFHDYTQDSFERSFTKYFSILRSEKIKDSQRTLYLMKRRI